MLVISNIDEGNLQSSETMNSKAFNSDNRCFIVNKYHFNMCLLSTFEEFNAILIFISFRVELDTSVGGDCFHCFMDHIFCIL